MFDLEGHRTPTPRQHPPAKLGACSEIGRDINREKRCVAKVLNQYGYDHGWYRLTPEDQADFRFALSRLAQQRFGRNVRVNQSFVGRRWRIGP